MISTIIATEVFGILVCFALLYGNIFEVKQESKKKDCYSILTAIVIIASLSDMLSWILDGDALHTRFLYISSFLAIFLTFVIIGLYMQYLLYHISEHEDFTKHSLIPYVVILAAALIWTIAATLNGTLFRIHNGVYEEGPHYFIYLAFNALLILYEVVYILIYRKKLGWHDTIAFLIYLILPIIAMIINMFVPDYSLSYPAISIALLIIYMMLQSENEKNLIEKEILSTGIAHHDILTGLLNRYAFEEKLANDTGTSSMGVVYADVNALKYTNDRSGHKAGDQLLCDFSRLLLSFFRADDVYRISGDEFVVLMKDVSAHTFNGRVEIMRQKIVESGVPIASIGTVYSQRGSAQELLNQAEKLMYEDKARYHEAYPEFSRRGEI